MVAFALRQESTLPDQRRYFHRPFVKELWLLFFIQTVLLDPPPCKKKGKVLFHNAIFVFDKSLTSVLVLKPC